MAKKAKAEDSIEGLTGHHFVDPNAVWEAYPTGIPDIDYITGVDGIPKGKMTIAFGASKTGKSSTFLMAAAAVQKEGKRVIWLDYEDAYNVKWAKDLGVDPEAVDENGDPMFVLCNHMSLEKGFTIARNFLKSPKYKETIGLIVFDSIGAMMPEALMGEDANLNQNMARANRLSTMIPLMLNDWMVGNEQTALGFVNHEKVSVDFGANLGAEQKVNMPGGKAPEFFSSLILRFKHAGKDYEKVDDGNFSYAIKETEAVKVVVTAEKSRGTFASEHATLIFREDGLDIVGTTLKTAAARGVIEKNGSWYTVPAEMTGGEPFKAQGEPPIKAYLEKNPDVFTRISETTFEVMKATREAKKEAKQQRLKVDQPIELGEEQSV